MQTPSQASPPPPSVHPNAPQPPIAQKRSWFSRNWGWVLGCGCLSIVLGGVLLVVLFGVLGVSVFSALKDSDVYKLAMQQVKDSPAVREQLGTPIEAGYLVSGHISVNNGSGNADLSIPISGPKGQGTVTVRSIRTGGQWTVQYLSVQVDGKPAPLVLTGGTPADTLEAPNPAPPRNPGKALKLHEMGVKEFDASLRNPQRRDAAYAMLEEAVRRDPGNDALKLDLADAYVQSGHEVAIAYAIDIYEGLLNRQPQDDAVLARLADAYGELENYDQAFRLLDRRLALPKPNVRGAATQATMLAIDSRQLERGQRTLIEISSRNPDEPGVRLLYATLLAENGRAMEARAVVQEVQNRIPPGDPMASEVQKMLARLTP